MRAAGDEPNGGVEARGVIVVLWRAGLRISEALALAESDLDRVRGAIQVRHGKGGRRREVGMDRWAWEALDPWLHSSRAGLPIGALFCVLRGPDSRAAVLSSRGPCPAAQRRGHGQGASAGGGASAPACSRCRDVARVCRWSSSSGSSGIMRVIVSSEPRAIGVARRLFRRRAAGRRVFLRCRCG